MASRCFSEGIKRDGSNRRRKRAPHAGELLAFLERFVITSARTRRPLGGRLTLAWRFVAFAVLWALWPRAAQAEPPRHLAIYAEGSDPAQTRTSIARLAPAGVVVEDGDFAHVLKRGGPVPLGKAFDDTRALGERARKAFEASSVDLLVLVRVRPARNGRSARVFLFTRKGSEPEVDQTVALGKRPSEADNRSFSGALSPSLARMASSSSTSSQATPSPEPPRDSARASASASTTTTSAPEEPVETKP